MATQLHRLGTDGEPKVEALHKTLQLFGDDTNIYPCYWRVDENDELYGKIVISAVDSIAARKDIWVAVNGGGCDWYIGARMSAEEFQTHIICMSDEQQVDEYDKMITAEDDSKIPDIPCTQKATFYCAAVAAGLIGAAVRKIITGRRPAKYLICNMLTDKLFHLGDA